MPNFQNPLDGYTITSGFGVPRPGHPHQGVDMVSSGGLGAPIKASGGGIAQVHNDPTGYGQYVTIDHGGGTSTLYGHMNDVTIQNGQTVLPGQTIGHLGYTGSVRPPGPNGAHLHFEVRQNGVPVDPTLYLNGRTGLPDPDSSTPGSGGSSGSPGGTGSSSPDQKTTIETKQPTDIPHQSVQRQLDLDESDANWETPTDPHEPYYAAAEVKVGGVIICPFKPLKPLTVPTEYGDIETAGIDLRLWEFQFMYSYKMASVLLLKLFVKAWTDVVETLHLCAMQREVEFRYGYTNLKGGIAGPFYGFVVAATPEFLENGYTISLEILEKEAFKNNQDGAKTAAYRALDGHISDIVKYIADKNGWDTCIEETTVMSDRERGFPQNQQTDLNFIQFGLAPYARSAVSRPWIAGGEGYGPYVTYLKPSMKTGKTVLHFHPAIPSPSNPSAVPCRQFVWGGVMSAKEHKIGTVINFSPNFQNNIYQVLGGSVMEGLSIDIYKKRINTAIAQGTDIQDNILTGKKQQMNVKMSSSRRTRGEIHVNWDLELLKSEVGQRHFALRDFAFDCTCTVVGDPFMSAGLMINIVVVRPPDGVMMFYDWLIMEATHTIVGGEYTTTMTCIRNPQYPGPRASDIGVPGRGVGMLWQQSSVSVQQKGLKVGQTWDPNGQD